MGYSIILILVSMFREILGSGTLLGYAIIPDILYQYGYVNNGLMLLAPGAFIVLGLIVWAQAAITGDNEE